MNPSATETAPTLKSHIHGVDTAGEPDLVRHSPGRPDEIVSRVVNADSATVQHAVEVAEKAFPVWSRRPATYRADALRRAADILTGNAEQIGRDLAREEGKTAAEGVVETLRAAEIIRYTASQASYEPDGATLPSPDPENLLLAQREPIGPVAIITPWNFPIAIPAWKIAPALAHGNTVIWKPAELVPLTAKYLLDALLEGGVDPDAISLIYGSGSQVGPVITSAPSVAAVTFTGSTPVGRSLMQTVSPLGKRLQLEMGGKNPAIVLADADLPRAARAVANAAFLSAGQKCTATSRVIVDKSVAAEFTDLLAGIADEMVVGDPLDPATEVGPLASEEQADTVRHYTRLGRLEGRLATSRRDEDVPSGLFVPPTVFVDLPPESTLIHEEIFGPVVVVVESESVDEALEIANDTPFGLSASVFTSDLGTALKCSRELRVGTVKVNQESTGNEPHLPFGGVGDSSHGPAEQGKAAIEFFTKWKTSYIRGAN